MDTYEILRTKLTIPQPRPSYVVREALLGALDQGLDGKLTLISAPPGYGKTTLVSQWIAKNREQSEPPLFAWISLDEGDNDPIRFWRHIISACKSFDANIGTTAWDLLERTRTTSYETALNSLINDLSRLHSRNILVLEDYHAIQSEQIHNSITYLLDHLPPNLQLVITTRREPPLPLARLRVRDELTEITSQDLRFTSEEIRDFLSQTTGVAISPTVLAKLGTRLEGWAAGLRLVALALKGKQNPEEIERSLENLSGSHKHILDYLLAEVLHAQPESLQDFLLRTSVLHRLSGSLSDALTGRQDSAEVLAQIEKANLFIEPLDPVHQWYRYHTLFAEAMQQEALNRYGMETVRALYEKASHWFEEYNRLGDAVEAAISAHSYSRAAQLIERHIQESPGFAHEIFTLRRWLGAFPPEQLHKSALLSFLYANAILYTSDRYALETKTLIEPPLQSAESLWGADDNWEMVGRVIAFRSLVDWWQGDYTASFMRARQALDFLAIHDALWRGTCQLGLGGEAFLAGDVLHARQYFLEGRELLEAVGNSYGVIASLQLLGLMYLRQGELNQANELFLEVLEKGYQDLSDRAQGLTGLAEIAYERNELDRARQLASEGLELSRQVQEHDALVNSSLTLARVFYAQGELDSARKIVEGLTRQKQNSVLSGDIEHSQAWDALINGDLPSAERWVSIWEQHDTQLFLVEERRALMAARLQILGGESEKALARLDPWLSKAREQGRKRGEIEVLILQAIAWSTLNEKKMAGQCLVKALQFAQPEGFKRIFLDEGEKLAVLLKNSLSEVKEGPLAAYARALLVAFAENRPETTTIDSGERLTLEPLSEQEKRVLRLLAVGRTYREIADELIVSPNTVKTQLKSIYRKLGVSTRDQAREVARQSRMI
jgi:LuxR family transcriptional regulator, maltose regulon positive regulatory protein